MNEMAKTDKVLSRKEGGVGYVVFNNPARHNAMSLDMWAETGRIMEEFAKDDSLRCVVLTGAGEKAFVSGADISRFGAERSNEEAVKHYNATTEAASLAPVSTTQRSESSLANSSMMRPVSAHMSSDIALCRAGLLNTT